MGCFWMFSFVKVFFEIEAGGKDMGRITLELRADVVPKTAGKANGAADECLASFLLSIPPRVVVGGGGVCCFSEGAVCRWHVACIPGFGRP